MATTTTKPEMAVSPALTGARAPAWPPAESSSSADHAAHDPAKPSQRDALQALLAFSALHDQVRRRKSLAARSNPFDAGAPGASAPIEFEEQELFVLDEVLQLVAERAVAITGADGLAIALAENNEIVLRAAAGELRPDVGARIERDSAFSGACFRTAQVVTCDDTETDSRVNVEACRKLGARSMVAVPLCGRRRVIGVLEAFSAWPFAFNESDVRNLSLLAELVLGALKPEDEDRFAESAQAAATKLEPASRLAQAPAAPPSPGIATPKIDTPKIEARKIEIPKPEVAKVEAPKVDAAKIGAAKIDVTKIEAWKTDAPKFQIPTIQIPKIEAPKIAPTKVAPAAPAAVRPVVASPAVTAPVAPTAIAPAAASIVPDNKANEKAIAPAPLATILDKLADANAQPDAEAEIASAAAPEFASVTPDPASRRPFMLILLLVIVVATAFAGGVWWRLKTSQLNSAMIRTEPVPVSPATSASPKDAAPATPTPANTAFEANDSAESMPDSSDSGHAPASAQELSKFPRITGIRHWSSADSSTVVLDLQDQVQYEAHRITGPDRIYFDLRDTQLAADLLGKSIEVGDSFISRIRMAQPVAGMTRIVLETKANSTFSVSLESNPYRLVVEVRKIGATPKGAVNLFPNSDNAVKNTLAIVIPPPTKEDLQLRARVPKMRIVVDAGHGGWDLGTVGRRGLLEKDLVLEIAQRLGKLLESRLGSEVIYTRQDDNYIPLDERANVANQAQADLFVSVHANYSDLPSARGVETYYTNFFSAPGSKEAGPKKPAQRSRSQIDRGWTQRDQRQESADADTFSRRLA